MSLSHTHHHLSPGCPTGRPQRATTEEREEGGEPQCKLSERSCICLCTQQGALSTSWHTVVGLRFNLYMTWPYGHLSRKNEHLASLLLSDQSLSQNASEWGPTERVRDPKDREWWWEEALHVCQSVSLLTVRITAILLTLCVLVEWELSCKDEILFTFVIEWLWEERKHGAHRVTFMQTNNSCRLWDVKKLLQWSLKTLSPRSN